MSLREIAYRTGLYERSVQIALDSLLKQHVVRKKKTPYRAYFTLNDSSRYSQIIREFVSSLQQEKLKQRGEEDSKQALRALQELSSLRRFVKFLPGSN